jgi:hypothetical protein
MNNDRLLVCIASHYYDGVARGIHIDTRIEDLCKCINEYMKYAKDVTVIIDTNSDKMIGIMKDKYVDNNNILVFVHENLEKPFDLTWKHRKHMRDNIKNYDWFIYAENDMFIPVENYENYKKKFDILHRINVVPSFVRIEQKGDELYISDLIRPSYFNRNMIYNIEGSRYVKLENPYHAFWILPYFHLNKTIHDDLFMKRESSYFDAKHFPELGASYPMWQLGMHPLVELTSDNKISQICYSYHLNNIRITEDTPFGKLRVEDAVKVL